MKCPSKGNFTQNGMCFQMEFCQDCSLQGVGHPLHPEKIKYIFHSHIQKVELYIVPIILLTKIVSYEANVFAFYDNKL